MTDKIQNILTALNQANTCQNDEWQIWKYVKRDKTLVLCGYHKPFAVQGYLIFSDTDEICLPRSLEYPTFHLDKKIPFEQKFIKQKQDATSKKLKVTALAYNLEYYIVCENVQFFPVPKGFYVE